MEMLEQGWRLTGHLYDKLKLDTILGDNHNKILAYHSVGGSGFDSIPTKTFKSHLDLLTSRYEIVHLEDVITSPSKNKKISLTFDDGLADFYTNVLPILEEYGVKATVFVIGATVESPEFNHDVQYDYKYLSHDQIEDIASHPLVKVGNHTHTHKDLTELESEDSLTTEIIKSKRILEEKFEVEINSFAYPYNSYNERVINQVEKYHDFAVRDKGWRELITKKNNPCSLPRSNGAVSASQIKWETCDSSTKLGKSIIRFLPYGV